MPTITLTQADDHETSEAKVGDSIVLNLPQTPGGYRWSMDEDGAPVLTFTGNDFSSSSHGVGSAGEESFKFKVAKSGQAEISLKLWREWEGDSSIAKRFSVKINAH
jgi:inhibitor of cysteine peptidase